MQQTQNYKLNLLESTDPFSPAPLNENAQKTEAALAAETAARQALDGRVQVLELRRFAAGYYVGNSATGGQHIELGFTPKVVLVTLYYSCVWYALATEELPAYVDHYFKGTLLEVEEGGFRAKSSLNGNTDKFNYLALA